MTGVNERRITRLGSLVTFKTGKLDSNAAVPNGTYPFFTCSQETLLTNTYSFDDECVLLAGNNANGIFPLKYFHGKFDAYQRTYIIRPRDPSILATRFLYYALRPKLSEFRSVSTGAATKFLTLTILNETEIEIPSVAVQARIASILSTYDDLMENHRRQIRIMEEMARTLYREWFVHFRFLGQDKLKRVDSPLGPIPQGWQAKMLKDVADVTYGFPFQSRKFNTVGDGTPLVRIRDIPTGATETFTDEDAESKYHIGNGDILVGMDGDFHMCIWSSGHAFQNQRVCKFESRGEVSNYHLFLALEKPIREFNQAIVGTTVAHLGDMHIKTIQIAWPPKNLLLKARESFEPLSKQIITLKGQIANLSRTRDLLLPRLLSGQLSLESD